MLVTFFHAHTLISIIGDDETVWVWVSGSYQSLAKDWTSSNALNNSNICDMP